MKQKTIGSCLLSSVSFRSSPKPMKRPIKILWVGYLFIYFDLLAAFLFELDGIMTELGKIKFWEPTFIIFWLRAQRKPINETSVDCFLLRNTCLYTHLWVRNIYKHANLYMYVIHIYIHKLLNLALWLYWSYIQVNRDNKQNL